MSLTCGMHRPGSPLASVSHLPGTSPAVQCTPRPTYYTRQPPNILAGKADMRYITPAGRHPRKVCTPASTRALASTHLTAYGRCVRTYGAVRARSGVRSPRRGERSLRDPLRRRPLFSTPSAGEVCKCPAGACGRGIQKSKSIAHLTSVSQQNIRMRLRASRLLGAGGVRNLQARGGRK